MEIDAARPSDRPEIEALLDAAFGPGRHYRTASLLRAASEPIDGVSLIARQNGHLLGSIQYWPIDLVAGDVIPLTLLGPVAVAAQARTLGLGRRLLAASLAIADASGIDPILLIGDVSYYGPSGFTAAATGSWSLPGPVERHRLLLRQTGPGRLPATATVRAATSPASAPMVAA